ncbi:MAG: hypothetical protein LC790_23025, partial [Actinobacteria bacterium]|nr:hypothetical protein [Actinomycetota bacterium]
MPHAIEARSQAASKWLMVIVALMVVFGLAAAQPSSASAQQPAAAASAEPAPAVSAEPAPVVSDEPAPA